MAEQLSLFTEVLQRSGDPPPVPSTSLVEVPEPGLPPAEIAGAILEGLTPQQREAVVHGEGPLLIVAGAGTGKTTVITRRIAYLVASHRARPGEILALTFTEKAAAEMQERVDRLLPYGYADVTISTFHAFGDRILRLHALELGISPEFQVLSRPEQVIFLRDHLFDLPLDRYRPLGNPTGHLQALLGLFGRAKDEDVDPGEYLRFARQLEEAAGDDPEQQDRARVQGELARAYARYTELMAQEGKLDFGDQVMCVLRLFRQCPAVFARVRRQYRYLLVDEFQDTNHAQFVLVQMLARDHRNLTVVGDDDQSIYKFRGAAISNILQFCETYADARQVVLTSNFRSTQPILDAAYRLIRHNDPDRLEVKNCIDKRLVAVRPEGPPVEFRAFDTVSSEADAVASTIARWVEQGLYRPSDFAVLVRVNRDADPYLRALQMKGIPFRFTGNRGLYSRPEIRLVLSFLRVLCRPDDSVSLFHLAAGETYRLPVEDLVALNRRAGRSNTPLLEVFHQHLAEGSEGLSEEGRATLRILVEDLERYRRLIPEASPGRLLYRYVTESGWLRRLSSGDAEGEVKLQNLARFFDIAGRYEELHPQALLPEFVDHLDLLMEAGDSPAVVEADAGEEAVSVMTVHKAKGLEFPVVFMVGLVEGAFPATGRRDALEFPTELVREKLPRGDFHLQEERRLFYVGMTRARDRLLLSAPRDTGGRRMRRVSPFVLEALDRPRLEARAHRPSALEVLHRFAPPAGDPLPGHEPLPEDQVLTLSYRQIDDYLTCPLKYRYVHILRVPILSHHSVVYGQALHKAVSEFLVRRKLGEEVPCEFLLERFERAWVNQGFLTREHEERRFQAGREALRRFHAEETASGRRPTFVEKEFSFLLGSNRVVGRWDRVDGEAGQAVLVDYKSSDVRSPEEADRKARESLQLGLYCLAYRETTGTLPLRAELHFLESGLVGSTRPGLRDLVRIQERIREAAAGIRSRDYTPRPSYLACSGCAYREICPATAS